MLKINNTKRKIAIGVTATGMVGLLLWGFLSLTYVPSYANAIAEDNKTIDDIKYMQEMSPNVCNSMKESTAAVDNSKDLIDYRDGKTYKVAKLKDGNCWMVQNLAIIDKAISSEDSDMISGNFTIPESDISNYGSNIPQAYYDSAYGGYYNWYTATAGSGTDINFNPGYTNRDASSSICPKGWQLPTSNNTNSKSFGMLTNGISAGNILISSPYNFTYSGNIVVGSPVNVGKMGYYWSSTASASGMAYYLVFGSTSVTPSANFNTVNGMSVRCVNRNTFYNWQVPIPPLEDNQLRNNINVTIPPILTVEASSNVSGDITPAVVKEGTIAAKVDANVSYDITLSANEPNLTNKADPSGPNIPASSNVAPNTNGWGIKTNNNTYTPITTIPSIYYNTKSTDSTGSDIYNYGIGISISPSLPAGTYSTDVTITVSSK